MLSATYLHPAPLNLAVRGASPAQLHKREFRHGSALGRHRRGRLGVGSRLSPAPTRCTSRGHGTVPACGPRGRSRYGRRQRSDQDSPLLRSALRAVRGARGFPAGPAAALPFTRPSPPASGGGRGCPPESAASRPQLRGSPSGAASCPHKTPAPWPPSAEGSAPGFGLPGWRRGPAGSAPPPHAGQGTVARRACSGCR